MEEEISGFSHLGSKGESYEICCNLLKYYHRPVKTLFDPGAVITDQEEDINFWEAYDNEYSEEVPKFVTKGTQTDYRESETQTDPWDPPYKIIKVNKVPEVLALKQFTYGNGLPATKLELDYIIQTRKNDKLTEALDEDDSEKAFIKRKEISTEQIKTKWNYKVAIEKAAQVKKLEEMSLSLISEMSQRTEKRGYILKNMWSRKKEEMKKKHEKLEGKLRKEISAIERHLLTVDNDSSKISEFVIADDFDVNDEIFDLNEEQVDYFEKNIFSRSNSQVFTDLLKIKDWLEKKQITLRNKVPIARLTRKTQRESLAEEAYQNYIAKKRTKFPPKIYHAEYEREEISIPTPKPEDVSEFLGIDEKKIDLSTVLQRALRGLAIQKQMLHIIAKHKEAIDISLSEVTSE